MRQQLTKFEGEIDEFESKRKDLKRIMISHIPLVAPPFNHFSNEHDLVLSRAPEHTTDYISQHLEPVLRSKFTQDVLEVFYYG